MFGSNHQDKQGEFFNDISGVSGKPKRAKFSLMRITLSLSLENIIIFSIGLVMLLIVCYSLGVERGKQLARIKSEGIGVKQEKAQKRPQIKSPQPQEPEEKKTKIKFAQVQEAQQISPYIQVATFRTDKYAKKEQQQLKAQGYQPFVITRGKFKEVCVGGYRNKEEAKKAFRQLRKLYADCILHSK